MTLLFLLSRINNVRRLCKSLKNPVENLFRFYLFTTWIFPSKVFTLIASNQTIISHWERFMLFVAGFRLKNRNKLKRHVSVSFKRSIKSSIEVCEISFNFHITDSMFEKFSIDSADQETEDNFICWLLKSNTIIQVNKHETGISSSSSIREFADDF